MACLLPRGKRTACRPRCGHFWRANPGHFSRALKANENRDWRIFADFARSLIAVARSLYAGSDLGVDLDAIIYALDSTTIDLCLSLFPWARFRRAKGAVKLHTMLEISTSMPVFIDITHGKVHDLNALDIITPEPGSYVIMDKAYVDFNRFTNYNWPWSSSSSVPNRISNSVAAAHVR
jgi:hypothetical protein